MLNKYPSKIIHKLFNLLNLLFLFNKPKKISIKLLKIKILKILIQSKFPITQSKPLHNINNNNKLYNQEKRYLYLFHLIKHLTLKILFQLIKIN
jgi:hypothetical protein